ncbi:MAG: SigE family RNA polymerase sigma factor [Acidimicrobiia bacterium]|nr:SigE family RNA polymerase sigma factor [Acidimicrobiia bacterium]
MKTIPWMASGVSEGDQPIWHGSATAGEVHQLASFDDLYRDEYGPMVRLARGLVDTQEIAEEIVQDAFARVYERWNRLDNPGGYLRTAVVNGARSELRKREVRRRIGIRPFIPPQPEDRDYLLDALDQLPPRQKTILVLKFYADMTEKEIAQAMGVRPGTVKSATSRGLAELRKVVEK